MTDMTETQTVHSYVASRPRTILATTLEVAKNSVNPQSLISKDRHPTIPAPKQSARAWPKASMKKLAAKWID